MPLLILFACSGEQAESSVVNLSPQRAYRTRETPVEAGDNGDQAKLPENPTNIKFSGQTDLLING